MDLMTEETRPKAAFRKGVLSCPPCPLHFPIASLVISLICLEAQRRRDRLIRMASTPTVMSAISL